MAFLKSIKCSECKFSLLWGSEALYIRKEPGPIRKLFGMKGKKVVLKEPPVGDLSSETGGKSIPDLIEEGKIGHYAAYICMSCISVFELDSETSKLCNKCRSSEIKSIHDMIGQKCPKCKSGVIEESIVGIT